MSMKKHETVMGMTAVVEIVGGTHESVEKVFAYFRKIDEQFSPYKETSEISRINRGEILPENYSTEVKEVLALSEQTKQETDGFFNVYTREKKLDPSGLVKGWAIQNASQMLQLEGYTDFWVEIAGDIQTAGKNEQDEDWSIGIRNPFKGDEMVKVVYVSARGVATSGTYERGTHIYNPHEDAPVESSVISLTVIGPNVYEADRFATAAYAMGEDGIMFLEHLPGFEAYAIDRNGRATMTSEFKAFLKE